MAVPIRPAGGAVVEAVWGDVVHDTIVANDLQAGSAIVSFAAGGSQGSTVVTFPRPFAAIPAVTATLQSSGGASLPMITQITTITATAVTLRLAIASGTVASATSISVSWIAVGPRT